MPETVAVEYPVFELLSMRSSLILAESVPAPTP